MTHKVCGGTIIEVHWNVKQDGAVGGLFVCTQCQAIVHAGEIEGECPPENEFHVVEKGN